MSETEGQYTLEFHTEDDFDKQGPPFKYRSYYLEDTLADGWRHKQSGGSVIRITHEQRSIYEKDELERVFARISELMGLQRERPVRDIARQVMQEKGGAEVF